MPDPDCPGALEGFRSAARPVRAIFAQSSAASAAERSSVCACSVASTAQRAHFAPCSVTRAPRRSVRTLRSAGPEAERSSVAAWSIARTTQRSNFTPGSVAPAARRSVHTLVGGCAMLVAGCQTYAPAPLDLEAHLAAFEIRGAESESVVEFASRLRGGKARDPEDEFDPADGLSSAEAELVALYFNGSLRLARLEANVTDAAAEHAGLWEDPILGVSGARILSPESMLEFGALLGLSLPLSGRLDAERDRARAAHEVQRSALMAAEWSVRARVRAAYAARVIAEERRALEQSVVEQVTGISALTAELQRAGELGRTEARLLDVELIERQASLADAELELERADARLLALMGLPPHAKVTFEPELPALKVSGLMPPLNTLPGWNYELAVRSAEYLVAEEALRVAIAGQMPGLDLGLGYGDEDDDRLLFELALPLPLYNANRGEIAEASARREVARAAAELELERTVHELSAAYGTLGATQRQRPRYEAEILPLLAEQSAEIDRLVELGEIDVLLLLETVDREARAKRRLLDLELQEFEAQNEIWRILGSPPFLRGHPVPITAPAEDER